MIEYRRLLRLTLCPTTPPPPFIGALQLRLHRPINLGPFTSKHRQSIKVWTRFTVPMMGLTCHPVTSSEVIPGAAGPERCLPF